MVSNAINADFSAGISASRASRSSGLIDVSCLSAFKSRKPEARSTRRLCIAVNMYAEASATAAIRLTAVSRVHEFQAPCARMITTAAAKVAITDFRMALTDIRLSMVIPQDGGNVGWVFGDPAI